MKNGNLAQDLRMSSEPGSNHNGSFLGREEIERLGIACAGNDICVHASVVIVAPQRLVLGNHIRVDPFCVLSATGGISLGNHVHIGSHATLIGGGGIRVEDFAGISHGARIFSVTDDFSGASLTGPTVSEDLRGVLQAPIGLGRHAVIGAGAVSSPRERTWRWCNPWGALPPPRADPGMGDMGRCSRASSAGPEAGLARAREKAGRSVSPLNRRESNGVPTHQPCASRSPTSDFSSFSSLTVASIFARLNSLIGTSCTISHLPPLAADREGADQVLSPRRSCRRSRPRHCASRLSSCRSSGSGRCRRPRWRRRRRRKSRAL